MAIERRNWRLLYDVPKDHRPWPYDQWSQLELNRKMACWGWGHPRVHYGLSALGSTLFIAVVLLTFSREDRGSSVLFSAGMLMVLAINVGIVEVGIGTIAKRWPAPSS
jgi:hypothetical protein